MNYEHVIALEQKQKFELMEFVYDNTSSFIMNTFGYLWESRGWWNAFPIQIIRDNNRIVGMHAFTVGTKARTVFKTYYIITHKDYRGQGIAKKLTLQALEDHKYDCDTFFVNSEENSDGVGFYRKLFKNKYTTIVNEFGTKDYYFEAPIKTLLLENE